MTSNTDNLWAPAPFAVAAAGLPPAVRLYEVGPRDGLQAESKLVPTDIKVEFCRRLVAAGVSTVELTSFVSPKWIPQLADAEQLMADVALPDHIRQVVLAPNQRGLDRALAVGAREIAVFVSATETFASKNLNTTIDGALDAAEPVVRGALAAGLPVRGYISMVFGDPWEGQVSSSQVAAVAERLVQMGVSTLSLGDTIGVATPGHVHDVLATVLATGIDVSALAMHFHDTYGQALTNVYASLQAGITEFDSSAGGLGRCPYAKGATGNLATEDLLWMLHGLGITTGIDLDALTDTSIWMAKQIGHPTASRVVTALAAARS
ncbi:hydroxymethylglutaryl-CoA lyase [Rhodococcus sp. 05-2255-3B1]|uniref:hydroxymethylglutaryl-CoA lyase n=1 Tax=unclassified Rhodococcus (in: high G+C Gram-positive bacteria) TaxID=192944 RepID=UPI000B9C0EE3|nr:MULTISPECIES: hydroxymethylglutaryl-CoA lyase [unclassified Rhodococcus (in: high G+C Gram-positive bacteria)]OZE01684.1 hydroxymethylglutaryl-CoA lyase [Rhodococcus sp. 05-2255-3C]OZE07286.1 hydroxymethylglutaryl-CoA lyase [Rhodococcus sp. 05-2255-3B1]OZE17207.1 hydroxymethylglutaryl-CoA lyase [Rhodococcus sp. 05-2255-2A2]